MNLTTCQLLCLTDDRAAVPLFMAPSSSRALQIEQWAQLLEALDIGSPSIDTTADQMAEDLPSELVPEVNNQLAERGCHFRVKQGQKSILCKRSSH